MWPFMLTGNAQFDDNSVKLLEAVMRSDNEEALKHLPHLQAAIADLDGIGDVARGDAIKELRELGEQLKQQKE